MNTRSYKYIVVEDEYLIRKNLVKKIEQLHLPLFFTADASNGKDALDIIEKNYPEIVITDIKMPEMDGLTLAHRIHDQYPNTKVIILSGYDDFSYMQDALRTGVFDYLLKPVRKESLLEMLKRVLVNLQSTQNHMDNPIEKGDSSLSLNAENVTEYIKEYFKGHLSEDISIGQLAVKIGFTQEYLTKLFKKTQGETPLKYLTKLRMAEAKRLLMEKPDMEIQKIGELVGYKDSFYFSRTFKANTGMQPSEFRVKG